MTRNRPPTPPARSRAHDSVFTPTPFPLSLVSRRNRRPREDNRRRRGPFPLPRGRRARRRRGGLSGGYAALPQRRPYWAAAAVFYRSSYGRVCLRREGRIDAGNTVDFKIGGANKSWKESQSCSKQIPDSAEVWMIASVKTAPDYWKPKSCRKDQTHFYASRSNGRTIKYRTRGTTQNNNRCRINDRPSSDYLIETLRKHADHD